MNHKRRCANDNGITKLPYSARFTNAWSKRFGIESPSHETQDREAHVLKNPYSRKLDARRRSGMPLLTPRNALISGDTKRCLSASPETSLTYTPHTTSMAPCPKTDRLNLGVVNLVKSRP